MSAQLAGQTSSTTHCASLRRSVRLVPSQGPTLSSLPIGTCIQALSQIAPKYTQDWLAHRADSNLIAMLCFLTNMSPVTPIGGISEESLLQNLQLKAALADNSRAAKTWPNKFSMDVGYYALEGIRVTHACGLSCSLPRDLQTFRWRIVNNLHADCAALLPVGVQPAVASAMEVRIVSLFESASIFPPAPWKSFEINSPASILDTASIPDAAAIAHHCNLQALRDELQCPICLDLLKQPVTTPCGHNFCKVCLFPHLESVRLAGCPVCRKNVPTFAGAYATNLALSSVVSLFA